MAKKFELGNALADILGNVSVPDQAPEQIVMLPLASIDADEKNFYSVDGIEELAANIELVGLLDPIRVRENPDMPGRYLIVSGHRRRAALWTLYEENPEKWGKAPCIVEPPAESPEMQELRLIYANADTRKMSSADLSAQAERVEMLLYKLKDQGVEFPGRMRDHVAEACKVSATKLAELKVIREKFIPELRQLWEDGKLNHTKAYAIGKSPVETQRRLASLVKPKKLIESAEWYINNWIEKITAIEARKCDHCGMEAGQRSCFITEERLKRAFEKPEKWTPCKDKCCCDCSELRTCNFAVCVYASPLQQDLNEEREKREAKWKAEQEARDAARKEKDAKEKAAGIESWRRIAEAQKASGASTKAILRFTEDYDTEESVDEEEIEEAEKKLRGKGFDVNFYDQAVQLDPFAFEEYESLAGLADLLKCSTDYLLGRTEFLAPPADDRCLISVDDYYPKEGQYVIAVTKDLVAVPSVYFRAAFMDFTRHSIASERLTGIEWWAPLPQLPAGKKWLGQETIEGMVSGK